MAKPMTKQQAMDLLDKQVSKVGEAGLKRTEEGLPKMKASAKKLADALKAADSPELIDTQSRHLKLQMRPVAEGVALLDEAIRRIKEFEKDEEKFELLADELADIMKLATDALEKSRKELLAARKLTDEAATSLARHQSDSKEAEEEWAAFMTEFERKTALAKKEIVAWVALEKDAQAAVDARDKARLAALQKSSPASKALDDFAAAPKGQRPYADFAKEYDVPSLAPTLRKKIVADQVAVADAFENVTMMAWRKGEIAKRLAALKIGPRDAKKAAAVLGLPAASVAKLQAALDGPDAARAKALEAIAKAAKVELSGKDMITKLQKAGLL